MDYLWQEHFQYKWVGLLWLIIKLTLLYAGLRLAKKGSLHIAAPSAWQRYFKMAIHYTLLVFEPMALLVILSYFVLVNPFFYGLICLLFVFINFKHLRNYFSGRIILFDPSIHIGSYLSRAELSSKGNTIKGIISRIGRLGISMQTNSGLHFIPYDNLLRQPYNLLDRDEQGRFFNLKISQSKDAKQGNQQQELRSIFNICPYINWDHPANIETPDQTVPNEWKAHFALYHEQQINDLIALLDECGFSAQIAKL